MARSKYYVFGGRWRELDIQTGAVAGWGRRPHFVYMRRGRLRVAPRRRVLAALQAFAANRPSAVGFGVRISTYSREHEQHRKKEEVPAVCERQHCNTQHHCCGLYQRCNNNNVHCHPGGVSCAAGAGPGAGPQHRLTVDAAVQHLPTDNHTLTISLTNHTPPAPPATVAPPQRPVPPPEAPPRPVRDKRARPSESDSDQIFRKRRKVAEGMTRERSAVKEKSKRKKKEEKVQEEEESSGEMCKELTIPESDVRALRSYVARTRHGALARFDADDEYKLALFYAINPLVYVSRCPRTERAIRERLPLALKPFAARLGLTPSPQCRQTAPSDSEGDVFQNRNRKERRSLRNRTTVQETPRTVPPTQRTLLQKDAEGKRQLPTLHLEDSSDSYKPIKDKSKKTKSIHKKKAESTEDESDYQTKIDKTNLERIRRASIRTRRKSQSTVSDDTSYSDEEVATSRRVSLRTRVVTPKINVHDSDSESESTKRAEPKDKVLRSRTGAQSTSNRPDSRAVTNTGRTDKQVIDSSKALRMNTEAKDDAQDSDSDSDTNTEQKRNATRKKNETQNSDSDTLTNIKQRRKSITKHTRADTTNTNSDTDRPTNIGHERILSHKKNEAQTKSDTRNTHGDNDNRANVKERRNSLRNKNGIQPTTDTRDVKRVNDVKAKFKRIRNTLRNKVEAQRKAAQASDSDSEEITTRKRNKTEMHRTAKTPESDSENEVKTHKRDSLRKKTKADAEDDHTRAKIEPRDNSSKPTTSQAKTNKQESDEESSPVNRRISLRRSTLTQSRPTRQNSDSDYESQKYKQINKNKTKTPDKGIVKKAQTSREDSNDKREVMEQQSEKKRDLTRKKTVTENKVKATNVATKSGDSQPRSASERDNISKLKTNKQAEAATISSDNERQGIKSKTVDGARRAAAERSTDTQPHVISKRASASSSKEYSNLEDHAIVAWVLTGGRARLVNGNRLWRDLGDHYERLTGVFRSWHSLRNRYLRYILPGLGALHLPPADVSRLRAAAATGQVKAKRTGVSSARRNSIFHRSAVRSASARRPGQRPGTPRPTAAPLSDEECSAEDTSPAADQARRATEGERGGDRRLTRSLGAVSPARAARCGKSPRARKLFNPKLVL